VVVVRKSQIPAAPFQVYERNLSADDGRANVNEFRAVKRVVDQSLINKIARRRGNRAIDDASVMFADALGLGDSPSHKSRRVDCEAVAEHHF
jgi:hypothetical protein